MYDKIMVICEIYSNHLFLYTHLNTKILNFGAILSKVSTLYGSIDPKSNIHFQQRAVLLRV